MKSFVGLADMYGKEFFVNTQTGQGLDQVLKAMDPLLSKMAYKIYIDGYTYEDIKQHLSVIAMEGVTAYNPDPEKPAKLSTFLHKHMKYKSISWIKSVNKMSNNATYIIESKDECACGGSVTIEGSVKSCDDCGKVYNMKFTKAHSVLNFSGINSRNEDGRPFEHTVSESDGIYGGDSQRRGYEQIEFDASFENILNTVDRKTAKIMESLCYDYEVNSIKSAGKKSGLSGWGTSLKLREKLASRKEFRELYEERYKDFYEKLDRKREDI